MIFERKTLMFTRVFAIDQAILATGLCLTDDDHAGVEPPVLELIKPTDAMHGMQRAALLMDRIAAIIDQYEPQLIVMEEYAIGVNNTNNLTRLAEVGGAIKWLAHTHGYAMGYGTPKNAAERKSALDSTLNADKLFVMQTVTTMKKFCLGDGGTEKGTRYLLTVLEQMQKTFDDDNQADAYMHAFRARLVTGILRGEVPMGNLPTHQQEALLEKPRKLIKGMSMAKALKLSDEEKKELLIKCTFETK